jgi:5-methyltetrahydropteroyltriglutamate--homocysteine methyltransferase
MTQIQTTVVGSYPIPDWLPALPSQQALQDATATVFHTQELAGIDLVADGELYRFDVNHPDTNGMIDYFIRPLEGVRAAVRRYNEGSLICHSLSALPSRNPI